MKRLLKGGAVASGNGVLRADVLIDGEKIAAVGLNLPEEGKAAPPRLCRRPYPL